MTDFENIYCNENEYPDLDMDAASKRLSVALSCCTVNNGGDHNSPEFARLIEHIVLSFPTVAASSVTEVIGRSLLIHIKGSNPDLKPGLFMSHLDVVGVEAGTENQWEYPPFSGAIAEGYIWGRGALDIKNQVFAELEAAEYLLSQGKTPERDMYLAFGEDEETFQTGAHSIAKLLESRGVELEFLLDEGGGDIQSGADYCAPGVKIAYIHLAEKGYADLKVKAGGQGGHSSNPFGGSSMERLARAITAICDAKESAAMPEALAQSLRAIAPYVTEEPLKSLIGDIEGNSEAIMTYCAGLKSLFPLTETTVAPTMISGGGPACNVLPQDMEANINFRLIPGDSVDALTERCTKAVEGLGVELEYDQANNPSILSKASGVGYESILAAMEHYYRDIVFIPSISAGATDARQYECVCKACIRCAPFLVDESDNRGRVHGTNERISQRSYMQGIRVMIRMMEISCGF
jgi:carboxypeptidase PM20D1